MSHSKTRLWVAVTAAASVLLVAGAWFLLISPQRAEAAELRQQTVDQAAANQASQLRIASLKEEFAQLPQREAELAAIRQAIPADQQLPALTRRLQQLAEDTGVTLMSVSPGAMTPLVAAPAPVTDADGNVVESAAPATPSVQAVPVIVSVVGPYGAAQQYLRGLQTELERDYLVDNLNVVAEVPAAATGGKPATTNGDVTLTSTGRVFVLPGPSAIAPATSFATTTTDE